MSIWTFELPEDAEPVLCLDLSSLSAVTSPGAAGTIVVEAEARLEPLLDVTADGAVVSVRQTALLGRDGLGGIWPWGWGSYAPRLRITVPQGTSLEARLDAGSLTATHPWSRAQAHTTAGSVRLGPCDSARVHADAGSITIASLHEGNVSTRAGSVRIGTTTGPVSARTEAGSVKVMEAREGSLDLVTEMGTVSVGVPEGTAVLADCRSEIGRVTTDLLRHDRPDEFDRRLELRARTSMGAVRVRRAWRV